MGAIRSSRTPAIGEVPPRAPGVLALYAVAFQPACQVALLLPYLTGVRKYVRIAAFAASLLLAAALSWHRASRLHPAAWAAGLALLALIVISLLHPDTQFLAALGQIGLTTAVMAPLYWVARLDLRPSHFRGILLCLLAFHTLSAAVAVLQVYYPGRFQFAVSSVVQQREDYLESLKITLASGEKVFRPMGLTDLPGGAAMSGFYTCLFGLGLLVTPGRKALKPALAAAIPLGLFCLYLCQVRVMLVMTGICWVVLLLGLISQPGTRRTAILGAGLAAILVVVSFAWALTVGGEMVTDRLNTLIEGSPAEVYYRNRGLFMEYTLTELVPRYPLGAGGGRWGVMHYYFAEPESMLWAEIQWTGWVYDGGVPLMAAYAAAILLAIGTAWKVMSRPGPTEVRGWGALAFAYSVGLLASTFNCCPFSGTLGVEFWIINAALFQVALGQDPARRPALAGGQIG